MTENRRTSLDRKATEMALQPPGKEDYKYVLNSLMIIQAL